MRRPSTRVLGALTPAFRRHRAENAAMVPVIAAVSVFGVSYAAAALLPFTSPGVALAGAAAAGLAVSR